MDTTPIWIKRDSLARYVKAPIITPIWCVFRPTLEPIYHSRESQASGIVSGTLLAPFSWPACAMLTSLHVGATWCIKDYVHNVLRHPDIERSDTARLLRRIMGWVISSVGMFCVSWAPTPVLSKTLEGASRTSVMARFVISYGTSLIDSVGSNASWLDLICSMHQRITQSTCMIWAALAIKLQWWSATTDGWRRVLGTLQLHKTLDLVSPIVLLLWLNDRRPKFPTVLDFLTNAMVPSKGFGSTRW